MLQAAKSVIVASPHPGEEGVASVESIVPASSGAASLAEIGTDIPDTRITLELPENLISLAQIRPIVPQGRLFRNAA